MDLWEVGKGRRLVLFAFCLDVSAFTSCQLMGFPSKHNLLVTFSRGAESNRGEGLTEFHASHFRQGNHPAKQKGTRVNLFQRPLAL